MTSNTFRFALLLIATCAISTSTIAQIKTEAGCPAAADMKAAQLYGLWAVRFSNPPAGLPDRATMLLERHAEFAESLAGIVSRDLGAAAGTKAIAGHSANVALALPYITVDASGDVGEQRTAVTREGLGDAKLRLAMNLIGGPVMTPREFAQREPKTTLGVGVTLNIPTGEYLPDKLVNIGTNRWAAKTEVGLTHPIGKWLLEGYVGAWWFQDNDEFFGDQRREQDPLAGIQAHVSYTFKPRLWLALNTTYYQGGQTTLNGISKHDRQANSRLGLTFSMPLGKEYSLKLNWSRGATTRIGSNFTTYGVGLQYAWMDGR